MREVVIASACRTTTGTFGGSLKNISAIEPECVVTAEAIKRTGVSREDVDE
jgi:acetyl-CoA C-acetyltransferase